MMGARYKRTFNGSTGTLHPTIMDINTAEADESMAIDPGLHHILFWKTPQPIDVPESLTCQLLGLRPSREPRRTLEATRLAVELLSTALYQRSLDSMLRLNMKTFVGERHRYTSYTKYNSLSLAGWSSASGRDDP